MGLPAMTEEAKTNIGIGMKGNKNAEKNNYDSHCYKSFFLHFLDLETKITVLL